MEAQQVSALWYDEMEEDIPRTPRPNLTSLGSCIIGQLRRTWLEGHIIGPPDQHRQGKMLRRILRRIDRVSMNVLEDQDYLRNPDLMDDLAVLIVQALFILQQSGNPPGSTCIFRGCNRPLASRMHRLAFQRPTASSFEMNHLIWQREQNRYELANSISLFPVIRHDLHPARLCDFHEDSFESALEELLWIEEH